MDLKSIFIKKIAQRIKYYRTDVIKKSQVEFIRELQLKNIAIDRSRLSAIENGRIHKKKNPNLLSTTYVEDFSEILSISKKELILGTTEELEYYVKIILLNLLMNNEETNPFFNIDSHNYYDLFKKALFNLPESKLEREERSEIWEILINPVKLNPENIKEYKVKIKEELSSFDSFFFNSENYNIYEIVKKNFEDNNEHNSNLILKLLYSNLDFSTDFIVRQTNIIDRDDETKNIFLENFIENTGNYATSIINNKEHSYKIFINAFNDMYERNADIFIDFFNENLFNKIDELETNYMSIIKNEKINKLLSSVELSRLLNQIYLKEQIAPETFLGHNHVRHALMTNIIENQSNKVIDNEKYEIYDLLYDTRNLTEFYIKQEEIDNVYLKVNKFN